MTTILDNRGRTIDIHLRDGRSKLSLFDRDVIYQSFLLHFPDPIDRRGILREYRDDEIVKRAMDWFEVCAAKHGVTAKRIYDFVSQAIAAEAGIHRAVLERWDWWVGCSKRDQTSGRTT